jgi:tetratricopeptide (TPR) repeat protein
LAIKEKVTGKESLDLASTLNNIGLINNKLGKYKEAIRYYQRCLDIKEKIKGKDNIDCASILNNIGLL